MAFKLYSYISDDTTTYNARLNTVSGGYSGLASGTSGAPSISPRSAHKPRMVHGKNGASVKSIPVNASSDLWIGTATTFGPYTVTGRTGEKRPNGAPLS